MIGGWKISPSLFFYDGEITNGVELRIPKLNLPMVLKTHES